jgi:hypothetical protein
MKIWLRAHLGPVWTAGSEAYWWAKKRRYRWSPVRWLDDVHARAFDRRYAVDMRTIVPADSLGIAESRVQVALRYQASSLKPTARPAYYAEQHDSGLSPAVPRVLPHRSRHLQSVVAIW